MFLLLIEGQSNAFECEVNSYSDEDLVIKESTFRPQDKIYVKLSCKQLPPGVYNTHVNWILPSFGIFRSDNHQFVVEDGSGDRMIYYWMQLSKNDTFTSLFNNSDYRDEYYGEWIVETYVNDFALPRRTININ